MLNSGAIEAASLSGVFTERVHIPKGTLGEVSRVKQEVLEFEDAASRKNPIQALTELAHLYGAVEAYLKKHHPTVTMDHLATMNTTMGQP